MRLAPVLLAPAYLALLHGPQPATTQDWLFGAATTLATALGGRLPLTITLIQSVLLATGVRANGIATTVMPLLYTLAAVAVFELWLRSGWWQRWVGTGAFVAAQTFVFLPTYDPLMSTASIMIVTAPPVLLGAYIGSVLRVAVRAERHRDQAVRDARAAERAVIARELHDVVAHHMASIAIQVGAARQALAGAHKPVDVALAQAHGTARAALADLGKLMTTLRDPATPGVSAVDPDGLVAALTEVVDRARAAGHPVDSTIDPAVAELDSIRRLAVLRVVQEAITNVLRHSGPGSEVLLVVVTQPDDVTVLVRDAGGGASNHHPGAGSGLGLVGMRERVAMLDGILSTGPAGSGWAVLASIPREPL